MSSDLKFVTGIVILVVLIFGGVLFFNNNKPTTNEFTAYAKELGLDEAKYATDSNSQQAKDDINRDLDYGNSLNIDSTPTFFVNGKKVSGAQNDSQWQALYDEAKKSQPAQSLDYTVGQKFGPDTASVKIMEFADFQCPACALASEPLHTFVANNKDVQLIYRHFPLPNHKLAESAALAAEAAGKQGKFWEMYALLYDKQSEWSKE